MAKLSRVLLNSAPKGKHVLATVDGPIYRYMLSLQRSPESALASISEDFSSDASLLYGKGGSIGFNANRCRFMSVVINALFYVEAYQSLVPPYS